MTSLQAGRPPAVGLLSASKETVLSDEGPPSAGVVLEGVKTKTKQGDRAKNWKNDNTAAV